MSHTATRFGTKMIVYGGYCVPGDPNKEEGAPIVDKSGYFSDVHVLDTQGWEWSQPKINGPVPNVVCR